MNEIKTGNVTVKTQPSKYHTIDAHDYWMQRNHTCPYCKNGSKPVHKSLLNSDGSWKKQGIKELE